MIDYKKPLQGRTTMTSFVQWVLRESPLRMEELA
jgi:hypothetical protein